MKLVVAQVKVVNILLHKINAHSVTSTSSKDKCMRKVVSNLSVQQCSYN